LRLTLQGNSRLRCKEPSASLQRTHDFAAACARTFTLPLTAPLAAFFGLSLLLQHEPGRHVLQLARGSSGGVATRVRCTVAGLVEKMMLRFVQ